MSNGMSCDEAVVYLIRRGEARERTSALDLLFGVIGTGIEWEAGCLQDSIKDNYLNRELGPVGHWKRWRDGRYGRAAIRKMARTRRAMGGNRMSVYDIEARLDAIDRKVRAWARWFFATRYAQVHHPIWLWREYYPLCEYSGALSVPDDVEPDWLAGAVEHLWLVAFADYNHDNRARAARALVQIARRFGEVDARRLHIAGHMKYNLSRLSEGGKGA